MRGPQQDIAYTFDTGKTALGNSANHKAYYMEQFKNKYFDCTEQKNAQKRNKLEMTRIEREAQQAKAKEPTQGFYQSKLGLNPALFESHQHKPSVTNSGLVTRNECQEQLKTSLLLPGSDALKAAHRRHRTLDAAKARDFNITVHQKLYLKTPILHKIPGFPDPDQDYSSIVVPRNLRSLSTKQSSASKPKMTWSGFRSGTQDMGEADFLSSIMNSTTGRGDDPGVMATAHSSVAGSRDMHTGASKVDQAAFPAANNGLSFQIQPELIPGSGYQAAAGAAVFKTRSIASYRRNSKTVTAGFNGHQQLGHVPTPPTAHGGGADGSSGALGFHDHSSVKFMVGIDTTPKRLQHALDNQMSPNSTNTISGGLFSIYPPSKTQRSPASLYRFNRNYHRRQQSTNMTSGPTEKPAAFATAVSQMRFNQPSQLKNHEDTKLKQIKSDGQDIVTGKNEV